MNPLAIVIAATLCFGASVVHARDLFTDQGYGIKAYGGALYEPRYCDPSGHLPMSACVMTNMNLAEDFLQRVIYTKEDRNGVRNLDADAIRTRARQTCDKVRADAIQRYQSGDLIDIAYWSCIRAAYHRAAVGLLK